MEMSGYGYVCAAGESFDGVARKLFGDEKYAAELLNANPEEDGKLVFSGGEVLRLPVIDAEEEENTATAPWRT